MRAAVDWLTPRNLTEVSGFGALARYYCRFISFFANIARLLQLLTRKNQRFVWKDEQLESFERLKNCVITASVLSLPGDVGRYVLDSDASDEALGLVLQQVQDGVLKVIAYASRALQPAERSYCATRNELLAIIYVLKQGKRFVCRTDHAALTSLFRTPEPVGQQARYLDLLGEYDMEIVHRPGVSHQNDDALSRRPCERTDEETACRQYRLTGREKDSRAVRVVTKRQLSATVKQEENTKRLPGCEIDLSPEAIRDAQRGKVCLRTILDLLDAGSKKPPWSTVEGADLEVQQLYAQWETVQLRDGIFYRNFLGFLGNFLNFLGTGGQVSWTQLLVPRSLRALLLQHLHAGPTAGHMGVTKTQDRVMKMAFWRG